METRPDRYRPMGWFYNRLGMGKNPQGQNAVKVSQKGQLLSRRGRS